MKVQSIPLRIIKEALEEDPKISSWFEEYKINRGMKYVKHRLNNDQSIPVTFHLNSETDKKIELARDLNIIDNRRLSRSEIVKRSVDLFYENSKGRK